MQSKLVSFAVTLAVVAIAHAQTALELPEVAVYSPRVANQAPVGTFTMAVSALRYEPQVDLQGRNLAEGQADITIRGGIFENTGVRLGALSVADPQTGHYLAELPVAPAMLGAPEILTGVPLALRTSNATTGAVGYDWRRIATRGFAQAGGGEDGLWRGELYQGYRNDGALGGAGVDIDLAHSESNGPIAFGDHRFDRVNGRIQFTGAKSQTDLFAGYQAKFFGWPNLYTPFLSDESENLETLLFSLNHRVDLGAGDFVEAGAYHRRNKDDYAFNRFAPLGPVHPFQHTTRQDGAAVEGRRDLGLFILNARGEVLTDFLESTSLTAGRYHSRTLSKFALVPEKSWSVGPSETFTAKAGATYDHSNRDGGTVSPLVELDRTFAGAAPHRIYFSYAQTTQEPSYTALNSSASSGLFRGNPNLGRETAHTIEVGASGMFAGWTFDTAVFGRRDRSLVDWTFRQGVTARTASAVDIDTTGFEAVARHSWSATDLVLGYTALAKNPDYRGATVDASFYALNYARQRLTAAVTVRLGHGLEFRMDNVARMQASNMLRVIGGNDAVLSTAALAYRPEAWRRIELTLEIYNLWNSNFQEVPAVPATPRQRSIGASYTW
jgi:vitamin B12 transporter